jgi:predicted metal-dependent hydrolase
MNPPFYGAGVVSRSTQPETAPEALALGAMRVPVRFLRKVAARRYILRLKQNGVLHVTIPRGGSKAFAHDFAARNAAWIEQQLEKWKMQPPCPPPWQQGTEILFRGEPARLEVRDGRIIFADQSLPLPPAINDFRSPIVHHLQELAGRELAPRTIELASLHQLTVRKVTIRNQRSRWGSCSTKAHISLNWRLVQTPAYVVDYIILHELMHLKHMNHSARFWKCVAEVCPEYEKAETWLKTQGKKVLL